MKVSDYIVEYLISNNVKNVFGYPGGMITHLMDSLYSKKTKITTHLSYHEQGAAFAACGYAQATGTVAIAYATSGPGATNLITGICNAYYDSIPVIFITGQVNTFESKGDMKIRQRGFQETNIVDMTKKITKMSVYIDSPDEIKYYLEKAFYLATSGRKGPILLDIPMNILKAEIEPDKLLDFKTIEENTSSVNFGLIKEKICKAKRPVILLGNGIKIANEVNLVRNILDKSSIPVVSSMLAKDVYPNRKLYYGFIGAYGDRTANFIVDKCDLLISIGSRLDVRQVGAERKNFAPKAEIIRVDIDKDELSYIVHNDEIQVNTCISEFLNNLMEIFNTIKLDCFSWINVCNEIRAKLRSIDVELNSNSIMKSISESIPDNSIIVTDVGQNQVWTAQSFSLKNNQQILFSGGHGAMGYSLPAAIGSFIGTRKKIFSINGDGGFQMNIQELQMISREKIPIKIIVFNNYTLGMIRHFQEMYFECNYMQTTNSGGYTVPNLEKIAKAYEINYYEINSKNDINENIMIDDEAYIIEVKLQEDTYIFPKLEYGKFNCDQAPLIDRQLFNYLVNL